MKPHIHYHSDCPFFAGCENMLVNFFNDCELAENYRLSFSYRFSDAYEKGFRARVTGRIETYPLQLLDFIDPMNSLPIGWLKLPVKVIYHLVFKYICLVWNVIILYFLFGKDKIDLLHINNGGYPAAYSCSAAVIAARMLGIPTVYVVNNVAKGYRPFWRWLDFLPDRLVAGGVAKFICGSQTACAVIRRVLSLDGDQVLNLPNGIAPRRVTESREQVLGRLGLGSDRFYLGMVAVFEERKGHRYLLEAMKAVEKRLGPNAPVLLVEGEGLLESQLKEFVRSEALNTVAFVGSEERVFNFMNAVDVMVLPSVSNEDFPNVVLEAMSLGKPVIASRLSGIPEQIQHEETGMLVEPRDVAGLADAIIALVQDRALYGKISRNARDCFNTMYTSRAAVGRYQLLYDQLLERRSA